MRRALTYVAFFDVIFIFFVSLSSFFGEISSEIVYYLAFLIPVALAYLLRKKVGSETRAPRISISPRNLVLTVAIVMPLIALVFVISWLTTLLLSLIGEGSVSDVSGNIVTVILKHALLTAVLEELLFRYVPLAYLSPLSKRGAVLFSALFFALLHFNLYQLPYALFAGVIFAAIDIAFDSILPSLLVHFANNLVSIFWIRHESDRQFVIIYVSAIFGLALISSAAIILMRRDYKKSFRPILSDKTKIGFPIEILLFVIMALTVAVTNL